MTDKVTTQSRLPLISKEEFVEIIKFMQEQDKKFDTLQTAMEVLSEGNYVDFWPHLPYNGTIIRLLSMLMLLPWSHNFNVIEEFCVDRNYGTDNRPCEYADGATLSTPEELYDYIVKYINTIAIDEGGSAN